MSNKQVGPSPEAQSAEFADYLKKKKEDLDRYWAEEQERCRKLAEERQKYYAELEVREREALEKYLPAGGAVQRARANENQRSCPVCNQYMDLDRCSNPSCPSNAPR